MRQGNQQCVSVQRAKESVVLLSFPVSIVAAVSPPNRVAGLEVEEGKVFWYPAGHHVLGRTHSFVPLVLLYRLPLNLLYVSA